MGINTGWRWRAICFGGIWVLQIVHCSVSDEILQVQNHHFNTFVEIIARSKCSVPPILSIGGGSSRDGLVLAGVEFCDRPLQRK